MHKLVLIAFSLLIASPFSPLLAADLVPRWVPLPGHGQLELIVPPSWHIEVRNSPTPLPPTIVLSGLSFQILVTVVWPLPEGVRVASVATIREQVISAARAASLRSAETKLSIQEIHGTGSRGYYFAATDSAPRPGEFKYLTQGIVHLDNLNLAFTILTNDAHASAVQAGLEAMRTASHSPGTSQQ